MLPTVLGGGAALFVIAVAVVVVVIGRSGPGEWVLTVGPSGDLTEVTLPVGACADVEPWTARRLDDASVVPCDDPHELEVIARDQLAGPSSVLGARSPRAFGVIDVAERWCLTSFELYVDALYEESIFDYLTLLPDERRWRDGDREVICLAVPFRDEDLLGSVRESRR